MKPCRVLFVISSLSAGGAQMMLYKLLTRLDRNLFEPAVVSLTDVVPLAQKFQALGVPLHILGMQRGHPNPLHVLRLAALVRENKPDLIQTWMYHADLIGGVAARLGGRVPVVWNIRHSELAPGAASRLTIMTARLCALLSRVLPARIICCAEDAKQIHARIGYDGARIHVIPNGFDLDAFRPDEKGRGALQGELDLPATGRIIGLVARFHPQKDHRCFIKAAAILLKVMPNSYFVLCGDGVDWDNRQLAAEIDAYRMRGNFRLLGRRNDIPRITTAFDLATSSSSSGEAFSNTLGEAMACEIPCVATAVGDAPAIVGTTGRIIPPGQPELLAAAWQELLELSPLERSNLGKAARHRIMEHYSLDRIVRMYQDHYLELLRKDAPAKEFRQVAGL